MAIFNEILVGRFNRGLQKLFGMKGHPPSPQISGELLPVLVTENMMSLELRLLQSWRSWANQLNAAGVAAQFSAIRLRNPAGSNVLAVIEKVTIFEAAADQPIITRGPNNPTSDLANLATAGNIRDVRMGPIGPASIISFGSGAAVTGSKWWQGALTANNLTIDVINYENQELVLGPNDQVTIWGQVLNQQVSGTFFWRERALEEGELQGLL